MKNERENSIEFIPVEAEDLPEFRKKLQESFANGKP